jgi:hypothetical protein
MPRRPGEPELQDRALFKPGKARTPGPPRAAGWDEPDSKPTLDPEGDRARLRDKLTPTYVKVMRWGGAALALAGLAAAFVTAQDVKSEMTHDDYDAVVLKNDLSWIVAGLGGTSFVVSWFLVPDPDKEPSKSASAQFELRGTTARLKASF